MGKAKALPNETLMREGEWCVVRSWERPSENTRRPAWWHDNNKSFITHDCPGKHAVKDVFVWPETNGKLHVACWRCDTPIPDGIKTVWIMHNWEALQNGT